MKEIPSSVLQKLSDHVTVAGVYNVLSEGLRSGFTYILMVDDEDGTSYQYPINNIKDIERLR